MSDFTQDDRPIGVETSLGPDVLLLNQFVGEEHISELFHFELNMLSLKGDIKATDLVGESIDFYVNKPDGTKRYFNGLVRRFVYLGEGDRAHMYRAEIVPWIWLLTKGSDCKVHEADESQTAKDIIQKLLTDLGCPSFRWDVKRTLSKRSYCVQYRETHYDFLTRMLAEEGIYFYFKHEKGKHELVLTDHVAGSYTSDDSEAKMLSTSAVSDVMDNIQVWDHQYEFTSGHYAQTDYDFENPSTSLMVKTKTLVGLKANKAFENYDHPGVFTDKGLGSALAKLRMEAEETGYDSVHGSSHCYSFSPGGRFKVAEHHNPAEKGGEWMLTTVKHTGNLGGNYVSGAAHSDQIYNNEFVCIPAKVVFRPRLLPKPRVFGVQSAKVVGPSGEEIHTDDYGRIKVQFHWDRDGKADDKSSFWVRVVTPWAGTKWGMVQIPRVGQEVIVDFLEGDPDQPIVTGMVYNSENMPPYELPSNKTQSGIKTRSSAKGGDAHFNEIRFEDKKGQESITVHAEKDLLKTVENDETVKIGYDSKEGGQTVEIYQDRDVTIEKGKDTLLIKTGNQTTTLNQGDQSIVVKAGDQTTKVSAGKISTTAMKSIELKCGGSSIKLEPAKITIKSTAISIEAQTTADMKSALTTVSADGILTLEGGLVAIN